MVTELQEASLRLSRVENMVMELHWALIGQWFSQTHIVDEPAVPDPCVPGRDVPASTSQTFMSHSKSKLRRKREAQTLKRLWNHIKESNDHGASAGP